MIEILVAAVGREHVLTDKRRAHLSFDLSDHSGLIQAMGDIARAEVADECFAFDPNLQSVRMQREGLRGDVKKLAGDLVNPGSLRLE